jgi:hypothetical protein
MGAILCRVGARSANVPAEASAIFSGLEQDVEKKMQINGVVPPRTKNFHY